MSDCHVVLETAKLLLYRRLGSCIIHVKWKAWVLLHADSHRTQLLLKWALLQLTSCTPFCRHG